MSGFLYGSGGGSSQARNPQTTTQSIGRVGNVGTTVSANASANTAGTAVQLGTTGNALRAMELQFVPSTNGRYLIELNTSNSWTAGSIKLEKFLYQGNAVQVRMRIPLNWPAATAVWARVTSSAGGSNVNLFIMGIDANGTDAPGFSKGVGLNFDGTNTRAASPDIAVATSPSWVTVIDPTAAAYDDIGYYVTESTAAPSAENVIVQMGLGASGAETVIGELGFFTAASGLLVPRATMPNLEKPVPSGSRLAMRAYGAGGTYNLRGCPIGWNA